MSFQRKRIKYITADEMNQHLKYVNKYFNVIYREKLNSEPFKRNAYIKDREVNFELSYKKGSYACTYICRKDSYAETATQQTNGGEAFRILSQYYKVPRVDEKYCGRSDNGGLSASPFLWYNPKYEGQWIPAYGYDLNSAYSAAMLQDMPDTSKPMRQGTIIPGKEIGFKEVLNPKKPKTTMLVPQYSGFSLYIFPLMKSPFKKFVYTWYNKKVNATTESEKNKAKGVLNMSIGQLQNVNPFLRAAIVGKCNELVESLIDEDTLFCNTDSIVSTKPLPLKIGTGIGEWKLEHQCKVAYKGLNYQWENGDLSFRGIPKKWFPKGWDITKDNTPKASNIYKFNKTTMRLEEVKYENVQGCKKQKRV